MTGVFTDNQPDFTWLAPYEEKVFVQNFLPYSQLGTLQNANTQAAIKLERTNGALQLGLYAIVPLNEVSLVVKGEGEEIFRQPISLQPAQAWLHALPDCSPQRLTLSLVDRDGREIISYLEHIPEETPLPQAATAPQNQRKSPIPTSSILSASILSNISTPAVLPLIITAVHWISILSIIAATLRWQRWNLTVLILSKRQAMPIPLCNARSAGIKSAVRSSKHAAGFCS